MAYNAFSSGIVGIRNGYERLGVSADKVARSNLTTEEGEVDLAAESVEQMTASVHTKASMKVVNTASELFGSIIDIFA